MTWLMKIVNGHCIRQTNNSHPNCQVQVDENVTVFTATEAYMISKQTNNNRFCIKLGELISWGITNVRPTLISFPHDCTRFRYFSILYCFNYCKLTFYVNKHIHGSELKEFALNTSPRAKDNSSLCSQMWCCNYMLTYFSVLIYCLVPWMLQISFNSMQSFTLVIYFHLFVCAFLTSRWMEMPWLLLMYPDDVILAHVWWITRMRKFCSSKIKFFLIKNRPGWNQIKIDFLSLAHSHSEYK